MSVRPNKRLRTHHYRDRISLEDDIEIVHSRMPGLTSWNAPKVAPRSPLRGRTTWTIGRAWAPEDNEELALDDCGDWYDEEVDADVFDSRPSREGEESFRAPSKKRRRSQASVKYRCIDCFLPDLTCKGCCVKRHQRLPFHIIEVSFKIKQCTASQLLIFCVKQWTGSTFLKCSLKLLGLEIHLNHSSLRCPVPITCHQDFRIIHTNGVHDVAISYCGCQRSIPQYSQLLRRRLYPASQISPRTCMTFELLRFYHLLSLTSKASTYDFYRALERLSDNAGTNPPKSRYRPLLRVGLQWRHLKMLKRAGRGHDDTGAAGTRDGELAIQCPSCPHPGINLPTDWRDGPDNQKFLYRLLICMDANFRLKNQLVSNYSQDPGLGTGWAYMVRTKPYESYVLSRASDEDISTCVSFLAIVLALTRFCRGLQYTGVGGAFCGRGEMFMPNGVGNLQKGERYANMDYIFASSVKNTQLDSIAISYDICCQWFTKLRERMEDWPQDIRLPYQISITPLIPKFHEPAHKDKNHEQYSFNLVAGVGNSDGECPERAWAGHNGLGNATKTQGPGSRHDILDDHFGFWNWRKYCGMGRSHRGFTASLPEASVAEWEEMCAVWDVDTVPKTTPNPYSVAGSEMTSAKVYEELRKEEDRNGAESRPLHSTGPVDFIRIGLELEEMHRLSKNIRDWELIRATYMPGLLQFQTESGAGGPAIWDGDPNPEDVDLFLPSQIPESHRSSVCVGRLSALEGRYREAQCLDALDTLRQTLRIKTRMIQFKNKNVRGQAQSTRSRSIIDRVHRRALVSVEKYRVARAAKLRLSGPGSWEDTLRPLLNSDVRGYSDPRRNGQGPGRRGIWEDDHQPDAVAEGEGGDAELEAIPPERGRREGTGRTTHKISWIWMAAGCHSDAVGQDGEEIVRAEWARSRARVQRCVEEVQLLVEEMRRVLEYLDWKERWWLEKRNSRIVGVSPDLAEGLMSYAEGQAAMHASLSVTFIKAWRTPLGLVNETAVDEEDEADVLNAAERDGIDLDEIELEDDDEVVVDNANEATAAPFLSID
ncbi:hypothetical protein BDN70DRAFT_819429 [Pholiota conissans]|uniref:CxC2-like cysteine cluster KDZ transposase-associated domain-containing protein n=1 Tax=Pholiota conissans TaxID=109636 RepID=A0A9P6CS93_9AGAR|nr:hypothetical protein BDN70DRAFT_819429 [Pholiota conissans]